MAIGAAEQIAEGKTPIPNGGFLRSSRIILPPARNYYGFSSTGSMTSIPQGARETRSPDGCELFHFPSKVPLDYLVPS